MLIIAYIPTVLNQAWDCSPEHYTCLAVKHGERLVDPSLELLQLQALNTWQIIFAWYLKVFFMHLIFGAYQAFESI